MFANIIPGPGCREEGTSHGWESHCDIQYTSNKKYVMLDIMKYLVLCSMLNSVMQIIGDVAPINQLHKLTLSHTVDATVYAFVAVLSKEASMCKTNW